METEEATLKLERSAFPAGKTGSDKAVSSHFLPGMIVRILNVLLDAFGQ